MRIALFATGGTIAMDQATTGAGVLPKLDAATLIAAAPSTRGLSVEPHDLFARASASISLADVQTIADRITGAFADGVDAAVVTHGTDTLEETAFALSLLLDRTRGVVITGAMRSAGAASADGPANLAAAIRLAASPLAVGQGPLVVFGDDIHAAHLVRKMHTSRVHAFSSDPFGPIGQMVEGEPRFTLQSGFAPARRRLGGLVPAVPILYVGLDLEPETVAAFAAAPIGGLIIAGVGGGHVSARSVDAIADLAARLPVVLTSRIGRGDTLRSSYAYAGGEIDLMQRGVLNGGRWRPEQARILLQIAVSNGADRQAIRDTLAD